MTKYNYKRVALTIKVSEALDDLLDEICIDLGVTKTSVMIYFTLLGLDPTGVICPDIKHLPSILIDISETDLIDAVQSELSRGHRRIERRKRLARREPPPKTLSEMKAERNAENSL